MGNELTSIMQDDVLDRRLRDAIPYINDDGFTARVVAQLPAARRSNSSIRSAILLGATLLASLLAYILSDGGRFIAVEMFRLSTLPLLWLAALAFGGAFLAMAGGLFAALAKTGEIR